MAIGRYIAKRSQPGSETHSSARERQERECGGAPFHEIAKVLGRRLDALPAGEGLRDLEAIRQAIQSDEATEAVPESTEVPKHLARKIGRAQVSTVRELIEQGYLTSADMLAEVLPQITSEIRASSIQAPDLRRAYSHIYRAFRRRRSLLLLNLASQVRQEELPWVGALSVHRKETVADQELAQTVMTNVVKTALQHFPHAILPNKLLQELRALSQQAKLKVPFVDEVAADIFMGVFTVKFATAGRVAGELLRDSLYSRYYGIDYSQIGGLDASPMTTPAQSRKPGFFARLVGATTTASPQNEAQAKTFSDICAQMADNDGATGWSVASNGTVIEQQQIITTQNLATLFGVLNLEHGLKEQLPDLARSSFEWICQRQQLKLTEHHARLVMLKNTAYAWRQMLFYVSLMGEERQREHLTWMKEHLGAQADEFQGRFAPAIAGVESVLGGNSVSAKGGRRFLGWSVGPHWLMPPKAEAAAE